MTAGAPRRAARFRVLRLPAVLVGVVLAVGACSPSETATPSVTTVPATSPTASVPPAPTGTGSGVAVDPALLDVLPAEVDGLAVAESADAEASILAAPELAKAGTAVVAAITVDPTTGEFAYAVVVRLRPGFLTDASFRDWRDTYDAGACSQADGVGGNAQAEIGGRTVYIGTCVGGLRTYHVWLEEQGLIVSISAVGDRRLGEQMVEGLRP